MFAFMPIELIRAVLALLSKLPLKFFLGTDRFAFPEYLTLVDGEMFQ
jgi:hypothetical protein